MLLVFWPNLIPYCTTKVRSKTALQFFLWNHAFSTRPYRAVTEKIALLMCSWIVSRRQHLYSGTYLETGQRKESLSATNRIMFFRCFGSDFGLNVLRLCVYRACLVRLSMTSLRSFLRCCPAWCSDCLVCVRASHVVHAVLTK